MIYFLTLISTKESKSHNVRFMFYDKLINDNIHKSKGEEIKWTDKY